MNIQPEDIDQIDKYLLGKLTDEEHKDFEVQLTTDEALQELVARQKLIINTIHYKEQQDFSKQLDIFKAKAISNQKVVSLNQEKPSKRIFWLTKLGIAASFLLLIGYFIIRASNSKLENNAIAEKPKTSEDIEEKIVGTSGYETIPLKFLNGSADTTIFLKITPSSSKQISYKLNKTALDLYIPQTASSTLVERVLYSYEQGGTVSYYLCLLYTSPSPRDRTRSRMPSSA